MTSAETRLKRFVHYGSELPLYQPGNRFIKKYYELENITAINTLIEEGKILETVNHIVKAFSDGYSAHPEALIFSLAVCVRQTKSKELRTAAYNAVKTVCKTPRNFFLFVHFGSKLSNSHIGMGKGWRRVVSEFYLSMTAKELAECVTRYRTRCAWSHRDLLKLSHVKADDIAKQAVLKYVMYDLKEVKKAFADKPDAQSIINYLQNMEDFKHCEDEQHLSRLIEIHSLTLDHVPAHFLKSREVWNALIPFLTLREALYSLKRLTRLRFTKGTGGIVSKVVDALTNQRAIAEANIHPAEVFVVLQNYKMVSQLKPAVQSLPDDNPAKQRTPPQPNPKIIEALNQLFASSLKLLVPTGMRYLVAIDIRPSMYSGKCWQNNHIKPIHAAVLQAMCLVRAERDVTVLAFAAEGGFKVITLTKEMMLDEAVDAFKEIPPGTVELAAPVTWAQNNNKSVDVFITFTDNQVKQKKGKPGPALQEYRNAMKLPNTKFITCGLSCGKTYVAAFSEDPLMLDVAGFDGHVPRVIEGFARGAF